jgi:hypothetical protein
MMRTNGAGRLARGVLSASLVIGALSSGCKGEPPRPERRAEPSAPGYGTVMVDVARRFEILGRAIESRRFELADYELGELEEVFDETLPRAELPKEGHTDVIPGLVQSFRTERVADLRKALETKDPVKARAALERAVDACNGCHAASGHGFIEVPREPGKSAPVTDPLPASSGRP